MIGEFMAAVARIVNEDIASETAYLAEGKAMSLDDYKLHVGVRKGLKKAMERMAETKTKLFEIANLDE